ncbi:MAG: hypothetical protein K2Y05_07825 [Hyphomicrobiaceae bacterium]|nr:hypothetical protein [Hyphomicrobiaceae bacterium]
MKTFPRFAMWVVEAIEQIFPPDLIVFGDTDGAVIPYEAWPSSDEPDTLADDGRRDGNPPADAAPYGSMPMSPFDVFAAVGWLLELSGAYHHIMPGAHSAINSPTTSKFLRVVNIDDQDIKLCRRNAAIWRKALDIRNENDVRARATELHELTALWQKVFVNNGTQPVIAEFEIDFPPPEWWHPAILLFITADEACVQAGFDLVEPNVMVEALWFMDNHERRLSEDHKRDRSKPLDYYTSLSSARQELVCVLPKARTTPVGCTLRSLSHHLALLPSRGVARAQWVPRYRPADSYDDKDPDKFNLLLVPFPFTITPGEFYAAAEDAHTASDVGFFRLHQTWLHGYGQFKRARVVGWLADFVERLARRAMRQGASSIDAVIFPELAFDWRVFEDLSAALKKKMPRLKFLISGLSRDDTGRHGNFVAVSALGQETSLPTTVLREKHHRWRLDRSQIEVYGLGSNLDPRRMWWEDIKHVDRRVDFTVFQHGSVLAVMICEDLARVDPCQELLRAVGPNIVVALLMDAPQLKTRWPARYATVLAEDPGSSVLTLTSRGLMTHQALIGKLDGKKPEDMKWDPVVALWRDDYNWPREIRCPIDAHGVWLQLWGAPARDRSIDGRIDDTAVGWIYAVDRPITIDNVDKDFEHLVGSEDIALRVKMTEAANKP